MTGAIIMVTHLAIKKSNIPAAIVSGVLFTPLLLERSDIRPELFGYFFFSLMLYILFIDQASKQYFRFIPLIFLLWVNIHISFIFGALLLLLFVGEKIIEHKKNIFKKKEILIPTLISLAALLINPHFINGVLYPLFIFQNYGYPIVENQNLFFLNNITFNPLIKYFFFLSPLTFIAIIILATRKLYRETIILVLFFCASILQIRHLPFFALTAIPLTAQVFFGYDYKKFIPKKYVSYLYGLLVLLLLFLSFLNVQSWFYRTFDRDKQFGLSVIDPYKETTDFVLQNKLSGNIFNNFDIGGYLIYRLYPTYKVFVDNRPEAYPAAFFQQTYIPLQLYEIQRKKIFTENNIKTVIVSHTDQTDWGKSIIASLYKDPEWNLVFINNRTIIFTQKTNLPDRRKDTNYLNNLVEKQKNYLSLLHLWQFFKLIGENTLTEKALTKAITLNSSSCTINKIFVSRFENSPQFDEAEGIKKNKWYCF